MKEQVHILNATPSKRLFLSIIADYDLKRSICELIDNSLDVWVRNGRKGLLSVKITVNLDQQVVEVSDNAGGLAQDQLVYVVSPGQTATDPGDETIGIFGVGTKRAVVALAQETRIRTRHEDDHTYQVDIDDDWLQSDDWELPVYEVDAISHGTTTILMRRLRFRISEAAVSDLEQHLGATYSRFLCNNSIDLTLNGHPLVPVDFDQWAYPPGYPPHNYVGNIRSEDGRLVEVDATAGLTRESSPSAGEYGVYFYLNDRLVARALKSYDVGFTKGLAGLPHPKVSLMRVIVRLTGDARLMPWNSSKSDINAKHEIFVALHDWLVQVVKDFAFLSRAWIGNWSENVFRYTSGTIRAVRVEDFPNARKSFLPELPKVRPRLGDRLSQLNKGLAKDKPWTRGLYEGVVAAEVILKQRLQHRARIALIILDSTLEIGFKEFLVYESGGAYSDSALLTLFKNRAQVQAEVQKYVRIAKAKWKKVDFYYHERCKLVHEKSDVSLSLEQVIEYQEIVEQFLARLFKVRFEEH